MTHRLSLRRTGWLLAALTSLASVSSIASIGGCSSDHDSPANQAGAGASAGAAGATNGGASGSNGASGASSIACTEATAPPLDVVDAKGAIVAETYERIASAYASADGLRYRLGEDASCYHDTPQTLPTVYQPPDQICMRAGNYGSGLLYQVGETPCPENVGDYSSTQGIALYAPDVTTDGGVNILQVIGEGFNTFQSKPQVSWTLGTATPWQLASDTWLAINAGSVVAPIATARSYRDPNGEMNVNALTVFQNGFIGAIGENTAGGGFATKLPEGQVPTSIALTNGNEFALITVWDPQTLTGKIAVFAMTSCEESTEPMCVSNGSLLSGYAIQHQPYPGFANAASYTGAKLLGLIELPDMHAPTAISATSNYQSGWWTRNGSNTSVSQMDFTNEDDRKTFMAGGENSAKYSSAGFAVVLSQSEKKASFIDLRPLFAFYQSMYFTTPEQFAATRDIGTNAHQWPYTFDDTPAQMPVVTATLSLDDRPTAVVTARYKAKAGDDGYDTLITTRGGLLTSYSVGGLVDGTGAKASDIRAIGTVRVGNNPTAMTYRKAHVWSGNDPFSDNTASVTRSEVIVVARGDRAIEFVRMDGVGTTGSVYKRLQDASMLDPVAAEDNDTHGTESYVLTVADHGGKQVLSYRFGPVILHTNGGASYGMGVDGKADFERGGAFAVPGKPLAFSSANVP